MDNGKEQSGTVSGRDGEIEREIEELNKQIEMELAMYSEMEYIAGKGER